ncbi:MAG: ClbS/DfsB family four-helix bundle protein [Candidatus Peribacteria bacterium]|nr:ClbS/DfsB family four-helix bundle protein [Candidatus Peribacteria bacterium]
MPRPTTKQQLVELAELNYQKLKNLIASFSETEQEQRFPFEDRDKNIKDVLVHLYERHQLLLHWETANMQGKKQEFLLEGYTRKTYPQMNIVFREKHQNTPLEKAKQLLEESHHQVLLMIQKHTNDELFVKKFYSWTGTTSLGGYCISATSSHYDWAMKKIKRYQKELKKIFVK